MKILVVEPKKVPYELEITGELKCMQDIVGGSIQVVCPYDEAVAIVCNGEGKVDGLPHNRVVGEIKDIIMGTFFICGSGDDDFTSLNQKQIEHFKKEFYSLETFMQEGDKIGVWKVQPSKEQIEWAKQKEAENRKEVAKEVGAKAEPEVKRDLKKDKGR